jgi:hypothetical protein
MEPEHSLPCSQEPATSLTLAARNRGASKNDFNWQKLLSHGWESWATESVNHSLLLFPSLDTTLRNTAT